MNKETKFKQTEIGKIPEDWEVGQLDNLCDITSSKRIFLKEYVSKGVPFYRSKEIILLSNNQEVTDSLFISKERFDKISKKFNSPSEGDLLMTSVGTLGVPYIVKRNEVFYFKDGNLMWFRSFKPKLKNKFLYYWIRSSIGQQQIDFISIGSTQKAITIDSMKRLKFALPKIIEQEQMTKILSSLDSRIELNQQMNKTLEEIGQAIFKHWFVDFEFPNDEGKPYKSSGREMVFNEELKKEIPKGWRVGQIKDLVNVLSGFAFSSSDFTQSSKYKLVTIKNVQDRYFDPETKDRLDDLPSKMPSFCNLKTGDILLSLTGNVGRICLVVGKDYLLNQRVAKLEPIDLQDYAFSYFLFLQESIFSLLQSIASGTAQQNLSPVQTKEIKIVIPSRKILNNFGNLTNTMIRKINGNNSQIQTLSQIRDSLLPKLMSGKIRVPLEVKA